MIRFASAVLAGLLGLVAVAQAQVTVLSPAQQCVASANAGGSANALTIPLLPCGASTNILLLNVTKTNTGASPTLQMLGFAAHPIVASNGDTVPPGALVAGDTVMLNSQGQNWRLLTRADVLTTALSSGYVWIGNASNEAQQRQVSGAATVDNTGVLALVATPATAELNPMIGDSGAGGLKGLVPAPAAGDAAASKFLKADGTWATAGGSALPTPSLAYTGSVSDAWIYGQLQFKAPMGVQVLREFVSGEGGWSVVDFGIETVSGSTESVTALALLNVTGAADGFEPATDPVYQLVTSLAAPQMKVVGGFGFFIGNMNSLNNVSFPSLEAISGYFEPNTVVPTTFDFSSLRLVGGDFAPSMASAVQEFPALERIGGDFNPNSGSTVTSIDVPVLNHVYGQWHPTNGASVLTISAPSLETVGGNFIPESLAGIRTMSYPSLETVGGSLQVYNTLPGLKLLDFPALTSVGVNLRIDTLPGLLRFSAPSLATIVDGDISFTEVRSASSIDLSGLQTVNGTIAFQEVGATALAFTALHTADQIDLRNMHVLTSMTLGAPIDSPIITAATTSSVPLLADVTLNSATIKSSGNIQLLNGSLTQASVDNIIHALYVLDGTNGTTQWHGTVQLEGTNTLSPSATGLLEAQAICARGSGVFVRLHGGTLCS